MQSRTDNCVKESNQHHMGKIILGIQTHMMHPSTIPSPLPQTTKTPKKTVPICSRQLPPSWNHPMCVPSREQLSKHRMKKIQHMFVYINSGVNLKVGVWLIHIKLNLLRC